MIIIMRSKLREAIAAAGLACALLVSSPAAAQPYRVVSLDPSLRVLDINTDLVAVGSAGWTGVPFIVRDNQPRFFPEAGFLSSATVTDGGRAEWANVLNGSVGRSTSISGSVPRGRYYARVRSRDAFGSLSGPSEEVVIDVPRRRRPPGFLFFAFCLLPFP